MSEVAKLDAGTIFDDPTPPPAETPPAATPPAFSIPDEYKDKSWAKSIDSMDSLLKQFDNAQSLIGKKTIGVPAEDASPEEWKDFYTKMGRPEAADAYEFEPQAAPEGFEIPDDFKRSEDEEKLLKGIFHEAGLTKAQAKEVLKQTDKAFFEKYQEQVKEYEAQKAARDTEMVSLFEKHFPGEKENAIAVAETMLKKYVPQGMEDEVRALDNKAMLALSSVLYKMHKESRAEGTFEKVGESSVAAVSPNDLRAEARKIMADPEYNNPFNKNQSAMAQKVKDLYARAQSLESQKR